MKQKILLMLATAFLTGGVNAQKKSRSVSAYAITAVEKGSSRWTEVRLIDLNTGDELRSVYKSADEVPVLNARTGKIIEKNEMATRMKSNVPPVELIRLKEKRPLTEQEVKELTSFRNSIDVKNNIGVHPNVNVVVIRNNLHTRISNAPFATQSAACAYDKKHDRLYYTPMGINQLRYIDLRSKTPQVFYFEDEALGALSGPGDVPNQVTRMAMGGDGNGYALTNNAEHLIRFETNSKAVVTDLGTLTDDVANGKFSVHNGNGYGGDMIADRSGNLYLITANRAVFKINIDSKIATYKGSIQGLPRGFTTNGAVVENGTNVIVTSSTSTGGYYKFDLNKLQAQKLSTAENVFNASDLANNNFISDKKLRKEEKKTVEEPERKETQEDMIAADRPSENIIRDNKITVYPNPVTNNVVNFSFADYTRGRYEIQVLDLNGKILQAQSIIINGKSQVQQIKLSPVFAKGSYMVKVINGEGRIVNAEKLIVQ